MHKELLSQIPPNEQQWLENYLWGQDSWKLALIYKVSEGCDLTTALVFKATNSIVVFKVFSMGGRWLSKTYTECAAKHYWVSNEQFQKLLKIELSTFLMKYYRLKLWFLGVRVCVMSTFKVLFQEWSISADLHDWKKGKGSQVSFYKQSTSFTMHLYNISSSWISPTENMVEK